MDTDDQFSILNACQNIHSAVTGALIIYDQGMFDDLSNVAHKLRDRIEHWKPSALREFLPYDNAIFTLATIALKEWDQWVKKMWRN